MQIPYGGMKEKKSKWLDPSKQEVEQQEMRIRGRKVAKQVVRFTWYLYYFLWLWYLKH